MKKIALALVGCLSLSVSALSMSFSLKLTGGGALILSGDYSGGVHGMNDLYAHSYQNVEGSFSAPGFGLDLGLELVVNFSARMGIGLGVGSLTVPGGQDSVSYDWQLYSMPMQDTVTLKTSVSSLPITLNFHYCLPFGRMTLDLFGGMGYYPSRMKVGTAYTTTFLGGLTSDLTFSSTDMTGQFGFQAGAGLEIPLGHRFAFVLDVAGRYVSLRNIKGDYTLHGNLLGISITKTGKDYYYYIYEHIYSGDSYTMLTWTADASEPSGGNNSEARHAHFNLTGVTARVGFKFRF